MALVEEEAVEDSEVLVAEALVAVVPVEAGSFIKKSNVSWLQELFNTKQKAYKSIQKK